MKKLILFSVLGFLPLFLLAQFYYPELPSFIPDCDLPGKPFMKLVDGKPVYNEGAAEVYAMLLNSIGEGVNISPEDALEIFKESLKNPTKMAHGYPGAISKKQETGEFCISFSEKVTSSAVHFVCRINDEWDLCQRYGCGNPYPVYNPKTKKVPIKEERVVTKECCDTTIVSVVVNNNITNNIPEMKLPEIKFPESKKDTLIFNQGCPKDKWTAFYPLFGLRTIYNSELNKETGFFGIGLRQNWTDTCKLYSIYTGIEFSGFFSKRTEITCDTCTEFIEEVPSKIRFRSEIFGGIEAGLKQLTNLKGFTEVRYAILQPQVLLGQEDREFLPKKSGFILSAGLRYSISIFELSGFYEYDPLSKNSGGGVKFAILFGRNKKSS